jgi:hypothetical protein
MRPEPVCPRCSARLDAPSLRHSGWTCQEHGDVPPFHARTVVPSAESVDWLVARTSVPLWCPWPLPPGWLVTGTAHAGDDRTGARATVLALSGPAPLGGTGELLLVAEELGVGLGAHLAGLPGPDAGPVSERTAPHARVQAAGHPTALWSVDVTEDRAAYVGEALGYWLWAILWPDTAGLLVQDHLALVDLRDSGHRLDLPFGAPSPRLA